MYTNQNAQESTRLQPTTDNESTDTMREIGNMGDTPLRTMVGVFERAEDAGAAITALREFQFQPDQVSIVTPDKRHLSEAGEEIAGHDTDPEAHDYAAKAASWGAMFGGITGGVIGWLVGLGALAAPGVGPVITAGIIGSAIAGAVGGAAVGAVTGGLGGALVGVGMPEKDAQFYEDKVKTGHTLVTVGLYTEVDQHRAYEALSRNGGMDIQTFASAPNTKSELPGIPPSSLK